MKKPYNELLGKPAPQLPETGWVGGARPNVEGRPYLIQMWAVWCGPCKNDFPLLKRLAENGATVVGLHPGGNTSAEVEAVLKDHELGYATFLSPEAEPSIDDRSIASYPANVFPYYLLVDAEGKVAGHGSLHENNDELLLRFRDMHAAMKEE